mgnify:CR=1 FL=1
MTVHRETMLPLAQQAQGGARESGARMIVGQTSVVSAHTALAACALIDFRYGA